MPKSSFKRNTHYLRDRDPLLRKQMESSNWWRKGIAPGENPSKKTTKVPQVPKKTVTTTGKKNCFPKKQPFKSLKNLKSDVLKQRTKSNKGNGSKKNVKTSKSSFPNRAKGLKAAFANSKHSAKDAKNSNYKPRKKRNYKSRANPAVLKRLVDELDSEYSVELQSKENKVSKNLDKFVKGLGDFQTNNVYEKYLVVSENGETEFVVSPEILVGIEKDLSDAESGNEEEDVVVEGKMEYKAAALEAKTSTADEFLADLAFSSTLENDYDIHDFEEFNTMEEIIPSSQSFYCETDTTLAVIYLFVLWLLSQTVLRVFTCRSP